MGYDRGAWVCELATSVLKNENLIDAGVGEDFTGQPNVCSARLLRHQLGNGTLFYSPADGTNLINVN